MAISAKITIFATSVTVNFYLFYIGGEAKGFVASVYMLIAVMKKRAIIVSISKSNHLNEDGICYG